MTEWKAPVRKSLHHVGNLPSKYILREMLNHPLLNRKNTFMRPSMLTAKRTSKEFLFLIELCSSRICQLSKPRIFPLNNRLVERNMGKEGSGPLLLGQCHEHEFTQLPLLCRGSYLCLWHGTWQHNMIKFKGRLNGAFLYKNRSKNYSPLQKDFSWWKLIWNRKQLTGIWERNVRSLWVMVKHNLIPEF